MHEREILERLDFIMSALTDLAAATAANTTAVNAAVAALAADATGSDSAAIEAAVTQLTTNNNALTAAVAPTSGAGPVVTAVSPVAVAVAGGTPVTISGSGFTDAQAVLFTANGVSVKGTAGSVVSDTSATTVSPPLAAGVYDVQVATAAATSATSAADQVTAS